MRKVTRKLSDSGLFVRARNWWRGIRNDMKNAVRDESGVALIAIVFVLGSAALVATAMVLLEEQGIPAQLRATQNTGGDIEKISDAIEIYLLQNDNLPCPADGTAGTGQPIADCDDTGGTANAGIVPWAALNLSEQDATDAYGNLYTYVAATNRSDPSDEVCERIGGDISGEVLNGNIEIDTSGDNTAELTNVIYAVIGHGENGDGGFNPRNYNGNPDSVRELDHALGSSGTATLGAGTDPLHDIPQEDTVDPSTNVYFDDTIVYVRPSDLSDFCRNQLEGGDENSDYSNDGSSTDGLTQTDNSGGSGTVSIAANVNDANDEVIQIVNDLTLDTTIAVGVDLKPTYIKLEWTPTAGTTGGLSIVTRSEGGSPDDPGSTTNDQFLNGLTFRFWDTGGGIGAGSETLNNISIQCSTAACAGANFTLTGQIGLQINQAYLIEVYDDGALVWGRITEIADPTNRAIIYHNFDAAGALTEDVFTFPNVVSFINTDGNDSGGSGITSQIDDILVGRGMGAVAFDGDNLGTPDYVELDGANAAINLNYTDFTLEFWINPDIALSDTEVIVSKWIGTGGSSGTNQSFILDVDSSVLRWRSIDNTLLGLETSCSSSFLPTPRQWTHVAVVFDDGAITFYQNAEQAGSCSATGSDDIDQTGTAADLRIGAGQDNSDASEFGFSGSMAELRIWNTARTSTDIDNNHRIRLVGTQTGLQLNWPMNLDDLTGSTRFQGDAAPCSASSSGSCAEGTLSGGAVYAGAFDRFIQPFADDVCPGNEDGLYSCVYEVVTTPSFDNDFATSAIPDLLTSVNITMWGGGGGSAADYDNPNSSNGGGGGGFGTATLSTFDNGGANTAITGNVLFVTIGEGGAGGSAILGGEGGGATSIRLTNAAGDVGMRVGGGGGGGTGTNADFDTSGGASAGDCDESTATLCGAGGGGGGVSSTAGTGLSGGDGTDNSFADIDACGGGGAAGDTGTGTVGAGGTDTDCATAGTQPGVGSAGGATGGSGGGGAGDGAGGVNNNEGGGGGGGASGGGAGNYGVATTSQGFGGGGGAGEANDNLSAQFGETGENGGTNAAATNGEAGGNDDPEYTARTYSTPTCTGTTPGRGGLTGNNPGCDGAVLIQW